MIYVKDLNTNKILKWSLEDVLLEINRDRSEQWTNYTAHDWKEGWDNWIEGDGYYTRLFNQGRECREPVVQTEFKRTTKSILSKSIETNEEYITIMAENYDDLCKLYFKSYDNRSKYNNNIRLEILDDKFKDKYKIWISDVSNYANNGGDMF